MSLVNFCLLTERYTISKSVELWCSEELIIQGMRVEKLQINEYFLPTSQDNY